MISVVRKIKCADVTECWDKEVTANLMDRSAFLQRRHLKRNLRTRAASHAGIRGEEVRAGAHLGHGPCQLEEADLIAGSIPSSCSLTGCPPLPHPPSPLWSLVCAAVSMSSRTQLLEPDPYAASPFTLVSIHNVWQTGGVQ